MNRSGTIVSLALLLLASRATPGFAQETPAPDPNRDRPRLVQIKVDGLSPLLVDALIDPDDPAKLAKTVDPEGFRWAIEMFRAETGQQEVLPNIRHYFYEQGVRTENLVAATITLSSVSWGVIETGRPSVIKRHAAFSRQNGYVRSHLNGLQDTWDLVLHGARKTSAVWALDQVGVSLFSDAFHPERSYITPWMYYRQTPQSYLTEMGKHWLTDGKGSFWGIARTHLGRRAGDMNYPEWQEQFVSHHLAQKILEKDFAGREKFDFLSTFFTIDHQFHVDPNPVNIVHRMARIDRRIGRILAAVEQSERRDQTLVTVVSDHGSEYETDTVNLSFPLTRMFRTRLLGGHTVATVLSEDAIHALASPTQGIDFPRVYEGRFSPYNKGKGGADEYTTAFVDNLGNARAEVHLRNNDLNRLHLLLLKRRDKLNNDQRSALREKLEKTLAAIHLWLEPEYAAYWDYYTGVRAWLPSLKRLADSYWRDAAARLESESQRDVKKLRRLARLLELCRAEDPVAWLDENKLRVTKIIPKKYFGPHNSVYQLSHYTIGLDEDFNWVESTVDPRGRSVPMDYFSVLSRYEVPNPPQSYERNPVSLIATPLPAEPLARALRELGWLDNETKLEQAVWVVSTAREKTTRGAQALVWRRSDGRIHYLPVQNLEQHADGSYTFEHSPDLDPVGLYYDAEFRAPGGQPAYLWLRQAHTYDEWVQAVYNTAYTIAPLVFLDIAGVNTHDPLDNPEFLSSITGFPDEDSRRRYLRGLRWKYAAQQPDLLLWSSYLWNFASKSFTAGGSHGGLPPHVAHTSFLVWGGKSFNLPAGSVITRPSTTLDIVPTLADLMGMLGEDGKVIRQPGSYRHRPRAWPVGRPLPVRRGEPPNRPVPAPSGQ